MDTATISTNPRERNTHDNAHNRRRMGKMDIKQQTKHETKIPQELTQIRAEAHLAKIMQKHHKPWHGSHKTTRTKQ